MCGLIGVISLRNRPAGQYAFELYTKQKTRGQRGFGYLAIDGDRVLDVKKAKTEEALKSLLMIEKAPTIFLHHRLPTSTDNTLGTAHPIFVSNDELRFDYYVAHNGIISNKIILKEKHNKLGYVYTTEHSVSEVATYLDGKTETVSYVKSAFNDSESLAIEIARHLDGLSSDIDTRGSVAFWCVAVEKGTGKIHNILYGKNMSRDLCSFKSKKWFVISSETGRVLDDMILYKLDINTLDVTESELHIDKDEPVTQQTYPRYGYHYNSSVPPVRTQPKLPLQLEDKFYTYLEAQETGHTIQDFESKWSGNLCLYKPKQFIRYGEATPTNVLEWGKEETSTHYDKQVERLEELALEYAEIKEKQDDAEEQMSDGQMDYTEYQDVYNKLDVDKQILEEKMSSLGLPDYLVEDKIEEALDLTYYIPK